MGWPIPLLSEGPPARKPSLWIIGTAVLGILMVGIALVLVAWTIFHKDTAGIPFWICLIGLPLLACAAFIALVLQFYGMADFRARCWAAFSERIRLGWQRWARNNVVLKAAATLTSTSALAEKIAGLEGSAPRNKTEVLELKDIESGIFASRTQAVFRHLLDELRPEILDASAQGTIRVVVWAGASADHEAVEKIARAAWNSLELPLCGIFSVSSEADWSFIGAQVLRRLTPHLVLCAQLHDNGDALKMFSESAVALMFDRSSARRQGAGPVVRLYRPMPASVITMRTDLSQLGEVGPFKLGQIRTAWNCGLGKAEGYALTRAVGDHGLVLDGGTNGLVNVSECIGPIGPIIPWLSLGLAAELVRYSQGPQLLAIQQGKDVQLAIAAADSPVPVPRTNLAMAADLRGAGLFVCVVPWFALLLGVLFGSADLFLWVVSGAAAAALCVPVLMLLHPVLVRFRAVRAVLSAGGRMPVRG